MFEIQEANPTKRKKTTTTATTTTTTTKTKTKRWLERGAMLEQDEIGQRLHGQKLLDVQLVQNENFGRLLNDHKGLSVDGIKTCKSLHYSGINHL